MPSTTPAPRDSAVTSAAASPGDRSTDRAPTADLAGLRLHIVSGKGGTGKTTVAAALALALAGTGRRILLVEVEGRQAIAQSLDVPPLATTDTRVAHAPGGGEVYGLAVDAKAALLEYLQLFYHLGRVGGILEKIGAIDFATTIAPGLRDVLQIGKVYESSRRTIEGKHRDGEAYYDRIVVDAPPTGRIVRFLNANIEVADLARMGPIRGQAESVDRLLHASTTAVHLVTLLEEMPVQETLDAVAELRAAGFAVGSIIVNQVSDPLLPDGLLGPALRGELDPDVARRGLALAGLTPTTAMVRGLCEEAAEHAARVELQREQLALLAATGIPLLPLPQVAEGIDATTVRVLADVLTEQGIRR